MTIKRRFRVSLSGVTVATASWATAITLLGAAEVAAQAAQPGQAIAEREYQIQKLLEENATRSPAQQKDRLEFSAPPRGAARQGHRMGLCPSCAAMSRWTRPAATVVDIKGEVTDAAAGAHRGGRRRGR